jgi:TolB-like protein/Flp pilus assembly protein TadD
LPLANISPDPADSYFADGLTEELISTASKVKELEVISRTSSMQYKNRRKSIKSIAKELNVATILEGSVRKAGNKVRITIQMIDAKSDRPLWVENYDRELQDIFSIQSEVARHVAATLCVKILSSERKDIASPPTESTEAYTLYLRGRYHYAERTRHGFENAMKCFEMAVEKDPRFALGYAALAECLSSYANYGFMSPIEAFSKARTYALKASEANPRLAEPHVTLGYILAMHEYRWKEAEEEFRRAERLNPSYASAYHRHSLVLRGMRRFDEAFERIQRAAELDPLSPIIGINVAETLLVMGRTKEAIERCEAIIGANPSNPVPHRFLAWAYLTDASPDQAISQVKKAEALSADDPGVKALLACALGFANRRAEAHKIISELQEQAKTGYVNSVMIAHALFSTGRVDEAFAHLEEGFKERSDLLVETRWWPWLKELRKDPRWGTFESRMGFSGPLRKAVETGPSAEPPKPEFQAEQTKVIFELLVQAFVDDYMRKRLYIEQSGWRSLTQISALSRIPQRSLYGRRGRFGGAINELISKGLVEQRTFTGQRGRGGAVTKIRVAYDREPTKRYVDRAALPKVTDF